MVARTASLNEEDIWHVQVADGDIRVVTLDQLDDLFRLDLIDDNVNVWQPGMPSWQPLKVVAGMDEDALKQVPMVSKPPPPPPRRAAPAPAPFTATVPVAVTSPFASTVRVAATSPFADIAPSSIGPVALSERMSERRPRASGGKLGRVVLALVAVAGILVTMYRNGLARDAAHAAHQDALYRRAEAALGPPGFGTLSSVERLTGGDPADSSQSEPAQAATANTAPALTPAPSPTTPPSPATTPPSATAQPTKPATETKPVSLDALPPESAAPTNKPVPVSGGAAKVAPKSAKGLSSGLKGSGNAYDPLNGKL